MGKATIYFSDKSTLQIEEGDYLIPVVRTEKDNQIFASKDKPMDLWNHTQDDLMPSIMDVFVKCDFFYLKDDHNTIYNSKTIVKIELV